jgi:hypothetical protein
MLAALAACTCAPGRARRAAHAAAHAALAPSDRAA